MKTPIIKYFLSVAMIMLVFFTVDAKKKGAKKKRVKKKKEVVKLNEITNSQGMELLKIKAGTYIYGSPKETPRPTLWNTRFQVKVTLSKDYYLSKYEVTQTQYSKLMENNPSHFKGDNRPVDSVTWPEAVEFCKKLSELPEEKAAGRVYSLPSSAEWEYACRAGTDSIFPWGNEDEKVIGEYAWCRDWYGKKATKTHPVGKKQPNDWGFYDMLGNVWEWTSDAGWNGTMQSGTFYYRKEGWVDPKWPVNPKRKVTTMIIRGGAWNNDFRSVNSWVTYRMPKLAKHNDTGFRVKCQIDPLLIKTETK